MSTRSIIAVPDPVNDWKGVYHHGDGYPTGLGVYLHRVLRALDGDVDRARALLIDAHPGGWSALFPSTNYAHTYNAPKRLVKMGLNACGLTGEACYTEHAISICYCHDPYFVQRDGPSPNALFYGDVDVLPDGAIHTDCEWLYLLTPDGLIVREIMYPDAPYTSPCLHGESFCKRLGEQQSLQGAVDSYIARCWEEGEEGEAQRETMRSEFATGFLWSQTNALPAFLSEPVPALA